MAAQNVNVVVITGNLTRDPEMRYTGGGTPVCELRVAVNSRRKDSATGEWVDKPNYFNAVVFGARGEACSAHLAKGRPVAIEGRLDFQEWEAKDGSGKRQAVKIVATTCSSSIRHRLTATAPARLALKAPRSLSWPASEPATGTTSASSPERNERQGPANAGPCRAA
jgi:single stranded DNA-binding protein